MNRARDGTTAEYGNVELVGKGFRLHGIKGGVEHLLQPVMSITYGIHVMDMEQICLRGSRQPSDLLLQCARAGDLFGKHNRTLEFGDGCVAFILYTVVGTYNVCVFI